MGDAIYSTSMKEEEIFFCGNISKNVTSLWAQFEKSLQPQFEPLCSKLFFAGRKKTSLDPQNEKKGSALNTFKIVTHRRKEKILNFLFTGKYELLYTK